MMQSEFDNFSQAKLSKLNSVNKFLIVNQLNIEFENLYKILNKKTLKKEKVLLRNFIIFLLCQLPLKKAIIWHSRYG